MDNTVPFFQIPVGLPSLGRGRRVKKTHTWLTSQIKIVIRSFPTGPIALNTHHNQEQVPFIEKIVLE